MQQQARQQLERGSPLSLHHKKAERMLRFFNHLGGTK